MPKVAYLTGVPGAGKSFIARQVMNQKLAQFIIGDEVRRRLIQIMCPNVRPLSVWSEGLWDQLEIHCNVQSAMDAAVNGYVIPNLNPSRPLLLDAYLTSHPGFRIAFSESLKRSGYDVSGEQLFWIDTPLEQVVAN